MQDSFMSNTEKVKEYYKETQFEYRIVWNWKTKNIPALHFGYYDDKATTHDKALIRANEVLAEWAGIKNGSIIADAGCGLGHASAWLSQRYEANVTGITIVPKQLETATKNIEKAGIKNVTFQLASYLQMPFSDNSLDVVWAFESACYAKDKGDFYKETYRVLRPGGMLVMAEYIRCERPLDADKEKLLKDVFGAWVVEDLDTIEEHALHSKLAGFQNFKYNDVTANVITSYRNLQEASKRHYWLAWLLYKTRVISKVRFNNMHYSMKQLECIQKNIFFYGHLAAYKPG
jgi:tocopherol O-methyltransferase